MATEARVIEDDISIALPSVEAYPLLLGWGGHRHPVYILSFFVRTKRILTEAQVGLINEYLRGIG